MHEQPTSTIDAPHAGGEMAGTVSVVIPAYNAAAYLPATLQSIRDQSLQPAEIIVVDDGSTDDTVRIAESFGARVLSIANGGPSAARNVGMRSATGTYIAFLDADDLWAPDKLERQLAAHRTFGAPSFSFTDFRTFDDRGIHPRMSELRQHDAFLRVVGRIDRDEIVISAGAGRPVLYNSYIPPSSVIVRRIDALAVDGFDESLRAAEDFEFYLRLLRRVPAIAVMKPLLYYRRHTQQATSNGTAMKLAVLDVAARVAASPERYPAADARYIARTEHLRYRALGVEYARIGKFDCAAGSFARSLAARPTLMSTLAYVAATFCRSDIGGALYRTVKTLWKRRPGRR